MTVGDAIWAVGADRAAQKAPCQHAHHASTLAVHFAHGLEGGHGVIEVCNPNGTCLAGSGLFLGVSFGDCDTLFGGKTSCRSQ